MAKFIPPNSNASEDVVRRVYDALALARREPSLPLSEVAERSGTSIQMIKHHAAQALERRGGRLRVKPNDNLRRKMLMLTAKGLITVTALNWETASLIGSYWNAVRSYITSGDFQPLEPFILRFIRAEEGHFEFLTHRPTLNRLARAGELHFQDLYSSTGSP
jgi:DNA-binding MarR family transcriptional regulator